MTFSAKFIVHEQIGVNRKKLSLSEQSKGMKTPRWRKEAVSCPTELSDCQGVACVEEKHIDWSCYLHELRQQATLSQVRQTQKARVLRETLAI